MIRMRPALLLALVVGAGFLLPAAPGRAQGEDFCEITKIEVEHVANAVRLRLVADGVLQVQASRQANPNRRLSFSFRNVSGGAASLVEVAHYPVSHLEFSLPTSDRGGTGLQCTIVLYSPGTVVVTPSEGTGAPDEELMAAPPPGAAPGPQIYLEMSGQRNELLITVTSDRPEEPPAAPPPVTTPVPSELSVEGDAGHLTVRALHTELAALVAALVRQTGVTIYADAQANPPLSVYLEDQPVAGVLTAVAAGAGLSLRAQDSAFFLAGSQMDNPATYAALETRTVRLQYLPVLDAQLLLPEVLLPYVSPNEDTNAMVLQGPHELLERAESDLRTLDQPGYQCQLRAWVVSGRGLQRALRALRLAGRDGETNWELKDAGTWSVEVAEQAPRRLTASLNRLRERSDTQVEMLPVAEVANGQEASLFAGEKRFYWRYRSVRALNPSLGSVEGGMTLTITPRTGGDWITARVSLSAATLAAANQLGPLVYRREAKATVRLRSGDTMIIGGLSRVTTDDREGRPPVWGLARGLPPTDSAQEREQEEFCVLVQASARRAGRPISTPGG